MGVSYAALQDLDQALHVIMALETDTTMVLA